MRRPTELLAASIIKDIQFKSKYHYQAFLIDLASTEHEVLHEEEDTDGTVRAIFLIRYNHKPMFKLQELPREELP